MLKNYSAGKSWKGRDDFPQNKSTMRWHHVVKTLNLNSASLVKTISNQTRAGHTSPLQQQSHTFLGFACDAGVKRNGGRIGAKHGPSAIKSLLTNLPVHFNEKTKIFDAGTITCVGTNLDSAQTNLGLAVQKILDQNHFPILLGGGHEIAWGHYQGLRAHFSKSKIGIINFDAHFDLRPLKNGGNSGTPFLQIANDCQKNKTPFLYFCLGIQKQANTRHLFETAKSLNVNFIEARDCRFEKLKSIQAQLKNFIKKCDVIYVTVCLDVFAQVFAPGVSAPTPFGIEPQIVRELLHFIRAQNKTVAFDVAELNPKFDHDNQTAKLAAHLIFEWIGH